MAIKNHRCRQIDLLLLCSAFIGTILPTGIAARTAETTREHGLSGNHRWQEEAHVAQGDRIRLQTASAPGLELIDGVGETLATAIISSRTHLLQSCNTSPKSETVKRRMTSNEKYSERQIFNSAFELYALDTVPGIGLVRSETILKDLSICD